jgi:hypothetical protein
MFRPTLRDYCQVVQYNVLHCLIICLLVHHQGKFYTSYESQLLKRHSFWMHTAKFKMYYLSNLNIYILGSL